MKEDFNHIDELLRSGLEGFEQQPSPGVWKRISAWLFFSGRGFYLSLIAVLIVVSGLIYYFVMDSDNKAGNNLPHELANRVDKDMNSEPALNTTPAVELKPDKPERQHQEQGRKSMIMQNENEPKSSGSESASLKPEPKGGPVYDSKQMPAPAIATTSLSPVITSQPAANFEKYPGLPRLSDEPVDMASMEILPLYFPAETFISSLDIAPRHDSDPIKIRFEDDYGKKINLMMGLHVTPELVFHPGENKPSDPVWNLDLTAYYFKNDWFLQAGAGFGIANDKGTFEINYAEYDSIGYYDAVQSFNIDPVTGTPEFITSPEALWDTVEYRQQETTSNRYTYLRLPFYWGLQLYDVKRLSVYLKAGGIYSVLLKSHEPGLDYQNDNATWIRVTNETPNRLTTNFQLSAGVALMYRMSNTFSISAEPVYNYYFNPVYRQGQQKTPWSVGLRTGIIFKLRSK